MPMDDFKKLATGNILFNLNRIIAPKLVTILYFLGLAAILLWAVTHFFSSFRFGFGSGLWGLLEIAVFGLLALVVLRIVCEGVIVYFTAHTAEADAYTPTGSSGSLIDDVRDALEELAEAEEIEERPTPAAAPVTPKKPAPADVAAPVAEEPAIMPDADAPKPAEHAPEKPTTAP
ncbi:DUF4282 domain-containing protein [Pelagibacterium luteolum]|uniref:DUF4282 domain-containing protein n=1 Tax=Pelagibacterium luteolum TaxID=440168 RepID=A0A1G7X5B2_9HYPH|nr:DUF4282 domain-containing protein [Pelagibacterium luteolum]SDG79331.1 protein of unknown function [Pelagibacterium luteolum]